MDLKKMYKELKIMTEKKKSMDKNVFWKEYKRVEDDIDNLTIKIYNAEKHKLVGNCYYYYNCKSIFEGKDYKEYSRVIGIIEDGIENFVCEVFRVYEDGVTVSNREKRVTMLGFKKISKEIYDRETMKVLSQLNQRKFLS